MAVRIVTLIREQRSARISWLLHCFKLPVQLNQIQSPAQAVLSMLQTQFSAISAYIAAPNVHY